MFVVPRDGDVSLRFSPTNTGVFDGLVADTRFGCGLDGGPGRDEESQPEFPDAGIVETALMKVLARGSAVGQPENLLRVLGQDAKGRPAIVEAPKDL